MSADEPLPRSGSTSSRKALLLRLVAAGFDESACARKLRTWPPRNLLRPLEAHRLAGARASAQPKLGPDADTLDILVSLFLFGVPVPERDASNALGPEALGAAVELGLVLHPGGEVRAPYALVPIRGLVVATDGRTPVKDRNRVMPLFAESWDLAALAFRHPVALAADLCTGSGIHALLASRHAREVIAVDVSPRAVAFSRFNAWLNGIDNVDTRLGDLFAPLPEAGIGLLTANPPYNPMVGIPAGADYASGGESGEEILERIVREAPRRLASGGNAQIVTLFCHRRNEDAEVRILRWLEESGVGIDALLLARPVSYRPEVLLAGGLSPLAAQRESWRRLGIERFEFGLLTLRRRPTGSGVRLRRGPFGTALDGPSAGALAGFPEEI